MNSYSSLAFIAIRVASLWLGHSAQRGRGARQCAAAERRGPPPVRGVADGKLSNVDAKAQASTIQ